MFLMKICTPHSTLYITQFSSSFIDTSHIISFDQGGRAGSLPDFRGGGAGGFVRVVGGGRHSAGRVDVLRVRQPVDRGRGRGVCAVRGVELLVEQGDVDVVEAQLGVRLALHGAAGVPGSAALGFPARHNVTIYSAQV